MFSTLSCYFRKDLIQIYLPFKDIGKILDDLEQSLPEELMGPGSINSLDGLANGETADVATSSPSLQHVLQSNSESLTSSASTTSFSSNSITCSTSISSPNSPSLTTLTPAKSPAMNYTMSSPPSMPVSTSGTPTPATPLTSSEHYLSSGAVPAPPSNSVTLSTMNSAMQQANMAKSFSHGQYNMMDVNALSNNMMASLNGPSVGNNMNSMNSVQRNGPGSYGRSNSNSMGMNMNASSTAANAYSLNQIQTEPLSIKMEPNFMTAQGLNGSLDSARSLQGNQVS